MKKNFTVPKDHITKIPLELLLRIMEFLRPPALANLSAAHRWFWDAQQGRHLWRNLVLRSKIHRGAQLECLRVFNRQLCRAERRSHDLIWRRIYELHLQLDRWTYQPIVEKSIGELASLTSFGDGRLIGIIKGQLAIFDPDSPKKPQTVNLGQKLLAITCLPGEKLALSGQKNLTIWDQNFAKSTEFTVDYGVIRGLSDGRLFIWGNDGSVRLLNLNTLTQDPILLKRHVGVSVVSSMLRDGKFALGFEDGSLHIWDPTALTDSVIFTGRQSRITSIAELNHGRIAAGFDDGTVYVWDRRVPTQDPIVFEGHRSGGIISILPLPDGRIVSVALYSGNNEVYRNQITLRIWRPDSPQRSSIIFQCDLVGDVAPRFERVDGRWVRRIDWSPAQFNLVALRDGRLVLRIGDERIRIFGKSIVARAIEMGMPRSNPGLLKKVLNGFKSIEWNFYSEADKNESTEFSMGSV